METHPDFYLRELSTKSTDAARLYGISSSAMNKVYKKIDLATQQKDIAPERGTAKQLSETTMREILKHRKFPFSQEAKIIAFLTNKGGVGKSTTSFFLSFRMASFGFKVLLIDTDSQGNSTIAFNLEKHGVQLTEESPVLLDVLNNDASIQETIIPYSKNLHLLPSTQMNSNLPDFIKMKFNNPSIVFPKILDPIKSSYDFIIIDCAPSLDTRNAAIACASDLVLLLAIPDKFSKTSIRQTSELLDSLEEDFNTKIARRIIFNRFDAREYTTMKYLGEIAEIYQPMVLNTVLRTTTDYKNCIDKNEDLFSMTKSKGKEDVDGLATEILNLLSDYSFNRKTVSH